MIPRGQLFHDVAFHPEAFLVRRADRRLWISAPKHLARIGHRGFFQERGEGTCAFLRRVQVAWAYVLVPLFAMDERSYKDLPANHDAVAIR